MNIRVAAEPSPTGEVPPKQSGYLPTFPFCRIRPIEFACRIKITKHKSLGKKTKMYQQWKRKQSRKKNSHRNAKKVKKDDTPNETNHKDQNEKREVHIHQLRVSIVEKGWADNTSQDFIFICWGGKKRLRCDWIQGQGRENTIGKHSKIVETGWLKTLKKKWSNPLLFFFRVRGCGQ